MSRALAIGSFVLTGLVFGVVLWTQRRSSGGLGAASRKNLIWTPDLIRNLKDRKGAALAKMRPYEFLQLTIHTPLAEWEDAARFETQSLEDYNAWIRDGSIRVGPFLKVDTTTKRVVGHEGRHRALAVQDVGGEWLLAGIILTGRDGRPVLRGKGPEDVPKCFRGEFKSSYECHHGLFAIDEVMKAAKAMHR